MKPAEGIAIGCHLSERKTKREITVVLFFFSNQPFGKFTLLPMSQICQL